MTVLNKNTRYLFSLTVALASVLGFVCTLDWIASREVGSLDSVFLLLGGALGALVFALLAAEARIEGPMSIIKRPEMYTKHGRSSGLFPRRVEA
ncbi:MAG: hypothetical protein ACM336_02550 [Acidobacteriota bacterium]